MTSNYLRSLIIIFCVFISQARAFGETFDFNDGEAQKWNVWGDGNYSLLKDFGHEQPGCMMLECSHRQQEQMHQKFKLEPGRYKISAYIRAYNVAADEQAIWLFYNGGDGIKTAVSKLSGTFDWSRVTWTMDLNDKEDLSIWFRLKTGGKIWIDDINLEPYGGEPLKFSFERSEKPFPKPNHMGIGTRCEECYRWMPKENKNCSICGSLLVEGKKTYSSKKPQERLLIGFEESEKEIESKRHILYNYSPNASEGDRSTIIKYASYNNFTFSEFDHNMLDWSGYDYIAVDIYNPLQQNVTLNISINDGLGGGYWGDLNNYTQIGHGWNKIKFQINRYVGERGSVKIKRYLNLSSIKGMWMGIDVESKLGLEGDFLIDNIRLVKAPTPPKTFAGLKLFDFVVDRMHTQKGFDGILSNQFYDKDVGFGFSDLKAWKSIDSLYADSLNRDAIGVTGGQFIVDIPNGEYIVRLNPNSLGLWYEHFWTRRTITIEGMVVLDEKRSSAEDYNRDFLRFSQVEPVPGDSGFDLYQKVIFEPIVSVVKVTDGQLNIEFKGDASAILLNSLILYPSQKKAKGERYIKELEAVRRDEFDNVVSLQIPTIEVNEVGEFNSTEISRGYYSAIVGTDKMIRFNQIYKSVADEIKLEGGFGERPAEGLTVRNLKNSSKLRIMSSSLKSASGDIIEPKPGWVRYAINQFQCHTYNHESYELAPRYLRNFIDSGVNAPKDGSLLIWYQIPILNAYKPGIYKGSLTIDLHGKTISYPITLTVYNFKLPPLDKAFGWFGLNPIKYNYFHGEGVPEAKEKMRNKVLHTLAERGFTTFSAIPGFTYIKGEGVLDVSSVELDALMALARKLGFIHLFTYGGEFNNALHLDTSSGNIEGLPYEKFRELSSEALKKHIKKHNWLPIVVDFSDEASGYSQKVERDLKRANILKIYYPFLKRGGFTQSIKCGEYGYDLNQTFTDVSISHISKEYVDEIKKAGNNFGFYNKGMDPFLNDRFIGRAFYSDAKLGMNHHLGWYLTNAQNYPYYDLDGRERDAMMIYPRLDGEFDYGLKFEWATQGIEDYRLLSFLEHLSNTTKGEVAESAKKWIKDNYVKDTFTPNIKIDVSYTSMKSFRRDLYDHILSLCK